MPKKKKLPERLEALKKTRHFDFIQPKPPTKVTGTSQVKKTHRGRKRQKA